MGKRASGGGRRVAAARTTIGRGGVTSVTVDQFTFSRRNNSLTADASELGVLDVPSLSVTSPTTGVTHVFRNPRRVIDRDGDLQEVVYRSSTTPIVLTIFND